MKSLKLISITLLVFVSAVQNSLAQDGDILIFLPAIQAGTAHKTVCGNGILEAGEQCDDGNLLDGDGCSSSCQLEPDVSDPEPVALQGITRAHNVYRQAVSESDLVWDPSTASQAQAWADYLEGNGCLFTHNPDFYTFSIGENMALVPAGYTVDEVVNLWGAEGALVDPETGQCTDFSTCGHYQNIVNPSATKLGCGVSESCGIYVCDYAM